MQRVWLGVTVATTAIACSANLGSETQPRREDASGGDTTSVSVGHGLGSGQGGYGSGNEQCDVLSAKLDAAIAIIHAESPTVGGVTMAVITEACGRWLGAAGAANEERDMMPGYLMRVGGVTETYVAATVIALAETGALSLDDVIDEHVTGIPNGDTTTVRMLLQHTSGIFDYARDEPFIAHALAHPDEAVTPPAIVDVALSHPATFEPNGGWSYSNTDYILAGMIIESVTGRPVGEVVREHMLTPHGLGGTFFDGEETLPAPLATGYGLLDEEQTHALHPSVPWTAGAMVANASDLAGWGAALYGGDVLSEAGYVKMLESVPTGELASYGLGVFVFGAPMMGGLGEAIGHRGDLPGYHADLLYLREDGTVIAVIVNSDAASTDGFVNAALQAVYR